jgi:glutamate N-acetyltransferase/amino-acid N-acetyltransferase
MAAQFDAERARAIMAANEVLVTIDLNLADAEATAWGCDLTHGYIDENTLYSR